MVEKIMKSIYDRFDSATKTISAYVIMAGADYVGRIVVKYPKDGAGRLTVFVHQWGVEPVAGVASGCGYDKMGAALFDAHTKYKKTFSEGVALYSYLSQVQSDGQWKQVLENAGYTVLNVI